MNRRLGDTAIEIAWQRPVIDSSTDVILINGGSFKIRRDRAPAIMRRMLNEVDDGSIAIS